MTDRPGDYGSCLSAHCITCADEGVPMRVERIDASRDLALCTADGGDRGTVEIALVTPVAPGDMLLVHAGVALARLAPEASAFTDASDAVAVT